MKWSLLIKFLIKRFPQWAMAGFIVLGSCVLFAGWLMFRAGSVGQIAATQEDVPPVEFDASEVILCGNTLVDRNDGRILAREWLQGFGTSAPSISRILTGEKLVIVSGNAGAVGCFGFDGGPKQTLQADGKPVLFAAFDRDFTKAIYPCEGNLWCGSVDWAAGKISTSKKITDTGYFKNDQFRGNPWLWHEDDLLVSVMGKTLEVDFDGSIKEVPVSLSELQHGMSPDGSFTVLTSDSRGIRIVDLMTGGNKILPMGQRVRKLLWLTPQKVAFIVGSDSVALYDHDRGMVGDPLRVKNGIRDIAEPSPDGSRFLVAAANSLFVAELPALQLVELRVPPGEVNWIDADQLLCSSNAVETETRGLWVVNRSGETEKISSRSMDTIRASSAPPLVRVNGVTFFVSGGDLWRFEPPSKSLKQITQDGKLPPQLQLLNH